jgi:hypothetical protein
VLLILKLMMYTSDEQQNSGTAGESLEPDGIGSSEIDQLLEGSDGAQIRGLE